MSEFFKILPRRMPEASLPAHATYGELLITTDTDKGFIGRGPAAPLAPLIGARPTLGPISSFSAQPDSDAYSVPAVIGPFSLSAVTKLGAVYAIYAGTITDGDFNAFAGRWFSITDFVENQSNNGTFYCVGSSVSALTLVNAAAVNETLNPSIGESTATEAVTSNNGVGCFGFTFQVSCNISVSQLGRQYISGNTQNHTIKLWDNSNTVTPIASATVLAASASDAFGIKWSSISPVVLVPGTRYSIAIDEDISGDVWSGLLGQFYLQAQFPVSVNTLSGVCVNTRAMTGATGAFPDIGAPIDDKYGIGCMYDTPAMMYTYTN